MSEKSPITKFYGKPWNKIGTALSKANMAFIICNVNNPEINYKVCMFWVSCTAQYGTQKTSRTAIKTGSG